MIPETNIGIATKLSWEVFDPFTIITIAVFDDYHFHDYGGANDSSMGKVRIRVSTLESGQINRHRWRRAWHPPRISHLSLSDIDDPDDQDEEFDTFPTSQPSYTVKMRYDHLRSKGSRIQAELEESATIGERFQSLIAWADPRATPVFLLFYICTSVLLCFIEFRIIAAILGFYLLRHTWLRIIKFPKLLVNFFTRLPSKADFMHL
uniref:Multiple C2 domain-containing protein n=1 Tax=Chenopodium quinoa TaxID=63459 RepID=A0A803KUW2_CHEQI